MKGETDESTFAKSKNARRKRCTTQAGQSDRADSSDTGIAALDALTKANKEESLRKLLGPGQRAESELEGLIRSMVLKAIDNPSAPRRGVLGIVERMATWSAGEDSDAARFVRAYVANDTAAQREIARSLAAA